MPLRPQPDKHFGGTTHLRQLDYPVGINQATKRFVDGIVIYTGNIAVAILYIITALGIVKTIHHLLERPRFIGVAIFGGNFKTQRQ